MKNPPKNYSFFFTFSAAYKNKIPQIQRLSAETVHNIIQLSLPHCNKIILTYYCFICNSIFKILQEIFYNLQIKDKKILSCGFAAKFTWNYINLKRTLCCISMRFYAVYKKYAGKRKPIMRCCHNS